ncbi:RICIN domain-containing protein [Streptomyces sp. XM83C]|uniref:RICIN domain-containing protein n=1 Tax=Streptomyces sp. XM83C TaxID=2929781 RepID=UPI001FF867C0|nr:ricin-type beta-trefoil lectin domain protein [Streptomyces sp. XM83C]MCK1819206.1 RICIN domain-containing protein [Streptomyces sp. XM83C]
MARFVRRGGILGILASLFVLLIPATATAADAPVRYSPWITNAYIYEMRGSYSWQCMDVRGESQSPGAIVQRFDCKGKLHQRFFFIAQNEPGLFMIGVYGKYCVGAQNAQIADGTPMVINHCQGPGQMFRWVDRGNNHWEIVEAASGKCLTIHGRREALTLGACGNISEPYPTLWTPIYDRVYNYTSITG